MHKPSFCPAILLYMAFAVAPGVCGANDASKASLSIARVQLLAQQLSDAAREAADGNLDAFARVQRLRDDISDRLVRIKQGVPSGTYPAGLDAAWVTLNADAVKLLDNQQQVLDGATAASDFVSQIPVLNSRTVELVKILVDGSASPMQIMVASRQMPLADRMERRVQSILKGGEESESAAEGLQRDADFYDVVLAAFIKDNADLKIKRLDDIRARAIVEDIHRQSTELAPVRAKLLELAPHLQAANEAANKATIDCQAVILTADVLIQRLDE